MEVYTHIPFEATRKALRRKVGKHLGGTDQMWLLYLTAVRRRGVPTGLLRQGLSAAVAWQ